MTNETSTSKNIVLTFRVALLWGFLATFCVYAQAHEGVEQQIRALESAWIDTYLTLDAEGFAALMAETFVYTSAEGEVLTKEAYVDNLASGEIEMRGFENEDLEITVYGDTAVTTGTAILDASYSGQDISGPNRFTRMWVNLDGEWKAVALHASIPDK